MESLSILTGETATYMYNFAKSMSPNGNNNAIVESKPGNEQDIDEQCSEDGQLMLRLEKKITIRRKKISRAI